MVRTQVVHLHSLLARQMETCPSLQALLNVAHLARSQTSLVCESRVRKRFFIQSQLVGSTALCVLVRFSQCDQCFLLKKDMSNKDLSMNQRMDSLKLYKQHIQSQYADRTTFWSLRHLAADPGGVGDVLVITLDGMDQGKFALPRDPALRAAAATSAADVELMFMLVSWQCMCKL